MKLPNFILNQVWSRDLYDTKNIDQQKMDLASFAREKGHIPVAYMVVPSDRATSGKEVKVLCIDPKQQIFSPLTYFGM